ncbi:MAG: hypothetical protein AAFY71_25660 [Bacteroidota bacterium]
MKSGIIIYILIVLLQQIGCAQSIVEIDSLLDKIGGEVENSKMIHQNENSIRVINYKAEILSTLSYFFTNSISTNIYSECQSRNLTKGELAMILADRIEFMPYFTITGVQNCLLTFCEGNSNFIEYYFHWSDKSEIEVVQNNYVSWLKSKDRKDWIGLHNPPRKRIKKRKRKVWSEQVGEK